MCYFILREKKGAAFSLEWKRFLPGSAEPEQHCSCTKQDKHSCPRLSGHLSVSCCQTDCVPFTLSQLPVMGECAGIMYRMLRAVQELILHTTSLIPIETPVIPHLQSQISPQSSLFIQPLIILLCNITSAENRKKKKILKKKSCEQMEIRRPIYDVNIHAHIFSCSFFFFFACCIHCRVCSGLVIPKC